MADRGRGGGGGRRGGRRSGAGLDSPRIASQSDTPYLDALREFAERRPGRLHVPGHKGGAGADPRMLEAIGERALELDIPALMWGIDAGVEPTPFDESQRLAAEAWGARRTWFLVNGASQGNHVALLALAHSGDRVVLQRNAHSSTVDALVLSGLRPTFAAPELDPELYIAHCLRPEVLDRALAETPGAVGAAVVSPTYFGAVADVAGLAEVAHSYGVPLVVDEAWGAHLAFSDELPAHALSLGADLVISSTHKIVGSLTQSAMLHLGNGDLIDENVVDRCVTLVESTSPNALLGASLDTARRAAVVDGQALLAESLRGLALAREAVREVPGLDVLDERVVGAAGVFAYDPLRLTIDVRGTHTSGYELARLMREQDDVNVELAGENVVVTVFGMGEDTVASGERLVAALHHAVETLSAEERDPAAEAFAPPPPWGELAMTPREAFLSTQEVVPVESAVGRIAAESLAAYPPGIPNVLPGERLSAETLEYIRQTIDHGGSLRGASDRSLHTLRVVAEG